jgi:hypothetical protein
MTRDTSESNEPIGVVRRKFGNPRVIGINANRVQFWVKIWKVRDKPPEKNLRFNPVSVHIS